MATAAPEQARPTTRLVSAKVFEVYAPAPITSVRGVLVPRALSKRGRRRKLTVEVHNVRSMIGSSNGGGSGTNGNRGGSGGAYDECIVRVLMPETTEAKRASENRGRERRKLLRGGGNNNVESSAFDDSDDVDEDEDDVDDVDAESVAPSSVGGGMLDNLVDYTIPDDIENGWKPRYKFPLKALTIKDIRRTVVTIEVSTGKIHQVRDIVFDTMDDAISFQNLIDKQKELEPVRRQCRMESNLGQIKLTHDETITYLFEICSAWDIPAGDFMSSDPYVICSFNHKEIHRTKWIPKTLDPIWTIKTDSLFILTVNSNELFMSDGIECFIKDYDKIGTNETLGAITIHPKTIYNAKGERLEYKLQSHTGAGDVTGYMAIRCRRATENDICFMEEYKKPDNANSKTQQHKKATEQEGGAMFISSMVSKNKRIAKDGRNMGRKEYKIRPGPDPNRPEETKWLSDTEIQAESIKESESWIDIGSGKLGRLFVEVIGCDELPNMDTGGFAGNKTDAFVTLVYEDSFVKTDVIDDTLSPRWMPWTKRAFIFHIMHSSSQLNLGVFDYDAGALDAHDFIGRVSIDLSNLHKDTTYELQYNLYTTARMSGRKKMGIITLRLRIEIEDERQLVLSNIEPPPEFYINVNKKKDFALVNSTCKGNFDMEKYSMKVINSYLEELMSYQHVTFYIQDAIVALLLWRGTMKLPGGHMFPIHSLTAFLLAILVVESPRLIPSLSFALIGWILLATMDYRRRLPDRWSQCKTYREFVEALTLGSSQSSGANIEPYENYDEAKAFFEQWRKRIADSDEQAEKAYKESLKAQEEYEKEMEDIAVDTDISTKSGGVSVDPFKPILYPVQQNLGILCRYSRLANYIITWEECYISFWVATGCFLLSFVFFFIPWFFLLKWCARLFVWLIFGPWMKLVDIYYVSKIKELTKEELEQQKEEERSKRKLASNVALAEARIKRENAAKLKAMKQHMFGKFVTRIPTLKEDRFTDVPLPASSAIPYKPPHRSLSELAMQDAGYKKTRVPGQHLVGDMIPTVEGVGFTEAPIGQATAHPALLSDADPAMKGGSQDSTVAAYATIGSIVIGAAVITWFGVPIITSMTAGLLERVTS